METYLLDLTINIRNHNELVTTTEVKDDLVNSVVKLRGLNIENNF